MIETLSLSRRRRWVALPFTDALGPLGSAEAAARLLERLDSERAEAGIPSLEARDAVPGRGGTLQGFSHVLALQPDPDELATHFSKSQVQRNIARAKREGVVVREAEDREKLLRSFYGLHLLTRRRQGVPIQPRRFFAILWDRVLEPGFGSLLIAEHGGEAVAAAVFLQWNGVMIYKFGAADPRSWGVRPNHALFWEAIRRGCVTGARRLDFGRTDSDNEGLRSFKAGWGTEESDLVYTTYGDEKARSGSGAALATVIKRSPPWVCQLLGKRLYRYAG